MHPASNFTEVTQKNFSFLQTFTVHCTAAFLFPFLTHSLTSMSVRKITAKTPHFSSFIFSSSLPHLISSSFLLIRVDAASAVNIRDLMEWEWWDIYMYRRKGFSMWWLKREKSLNREIFRHKGWTMWNLFNSILLPSRPP